MPGLPSRASITNPESSEMVMMWCLFAKYFALMVAFSKKDDPDSITSSCSVISDKDMSLNSSVSMMDFNSLTLCLLWDATRISIMG